MQKGTKNLGMRKHARGGHSGPSPKQKLGVALAANEEISRDQARKQKKRALGEKFDSVSELFKAHNK